MILTDLHVDREAFEQRTGWAIKPQGACKGDACVPLPGGASGGPLDVPLLSERLGMPLVHDDRDGLWAHGPDTVSGRALTTAEAHDLVLPDLLASEPFALSSLRGRKVLLVAWASW